MDDTVIIAIALGMMFFRFKTGVRFFNIISIMMFLFLMSKYTTEPILLLAGIAMIIYLLVDIFYVGKGGA